MSELQESSINITYDSDQDEVAAPEVLADAAEESELAPDTEETKEEPKAQPQGSVDGIEIEGPDGFKKAIDKQHRKYREQQRRADALQARIDADEAAKPKAQDIVVPPVPDSWDEDYESKIRLRDLAIAQSAQNEAANMRQKEQAATDERAEQRAEYDKNQSLQKQFSANTEKLGLDEAELLKAQNVIIDYGVTPDLASALLEDLDGPLMVQYLAANPLELYDITQSGQLKAGLLLAEVKAKAKGLRKLVSKAPDPADSLQGRPAQQKGRGPAGATFT